MGDGGMGAEAVSYISPAQIIKFSAIAPGVFAEMQWAMCVVQ